MHSEAVSYVKLSPNHYDGRSYKGEARKIDTITIHHTAGVLSVEALGEDFMNPARKASSNYGVGNDGRIACYVEEENTAWTSSSRDNDSRAITIEVVNSRTGEPWPVSEQAYSALIGLLVDICKRHGIPRLLWKNDKSLIGQPDKQNMTIHRWFSATDCPGQYLLNRMGEIADTVNARLAAQEKEDEDVNAKRYNSLKEISDAEPWATETVAKLIEKDILRGSGGLRDAKGRPADLDLSRDMLRLLVVNDRAGLYGE